MIHVFRSVIVFSSFILFFFHFKLTIELVSLFSEIQFQVISVIAISYDATLIYKQNKHGIFLFIHNTISVNLNLGYFVMVSYEFKID